MVLKIKPSARTSKRYFLIKGNKSVVEKAILDYIGILGWAKANPYFVKKTSEGLIWAVNRKEIGNVRGALAIASDKIEVLKVSGTLKGLSK
jgi:RNase P/RNase MRP subunit POP5